MEKEDGKQIPTKELSVIMHRNEWPWGSTVTFITEDGAGIVDMSFENNNPGVCYLSGLSVLPKYRRKHIASMLLDKAISYCRGHNIFRLDLNSVQRDWLMDFYHRVGFIDIEEDGGYMKMYKMLRV